MSNCAITSIGETPSTYERSSAWQTTGIAAAENVVAVDGKIGVVAIGMSSMNSIAGKLVTSFHADPDRHSSVTLVNGGISGKVARFWSDPVDDCWTTLADRITAAGLTHAQCQLFWILMTNSYPDTYGAMTEAQMRAIFDNVAATFVNAQVAWISSHSYTGYSTDDRAPEPYVYNDSLLLASLAGDVTLPIWADFYDIWADGETPNARTAKVGTLESADPALFYVCADFSGDGVHPASAGQAKIKNSILGRWHIDPVAVPLWEGGGAPSEPPPPARRGVIRGS